MKTVRIWVTRAEHIDDSESANVFDALHRLSFNEVKSVRLSRIIELDIDEILTGESVRERVQSMCDRLLVNANVERYEIVEYRKANSQEESSWRSV